MTAVADGSPADAALAELGALIGIPALRFDAQGCCQLAFDNDAVLTLIRAPGVQRLILSCPLAAPHAALAHGMAEAMLRASFLGSECAGGQLSLAPDGRPTLQLQMAYAELSGAALLSRVEVLLERVAFWRERLRRGEGGKPAALSAPHPLGERPPGWMLDKA